MGDVIITLYLESGKNRRDRKKFSTLRRRLNKSRRILSVSVSKLKIVSVP